MVGSPAASAVFDFENIMPQLDFLPIAARRALDHAGLRLSLEAWRSLSLDDRCVLVAAGADDLVDASAVLSVARRASPPAQRIEVVGDPDPLAPPDALLRLLEPVPLDARQWARLRALDRYALAHVHRRAIARNDPALIQAAYEDIVTGHLRSLRPPPVEPSSQRGRSSSMPPVPPPPGLPRTEGRLLRQPDTTPTPARVEISGRALDVSARARRAGDVPASGRTRPFDTAPAARYDLTPAPPRAFEAAPASPGRTIGRGTPAPPPAFDLTPTENVYASGYTSGGYSSSVPEYASEPPPSDPPAVRGVELSGDAYEIPELNIPDDTSRAPQQDSISSHLTDAGEAHMVDVGEKAVTQRRAVASAVVHMGRETYRRLAQQDTPKGDVLAAARIAGIQAAKRTSELIPLCHIVALTSVEVHIELEAATSSVRITATAQATDRTGVEMEAMVAASVAGLTIYDMLKGIDRGMTLDEVKLLEKSGGRTGHYRRRDA
ncbi:MAG: cyclic pyranopterin monophosphate synthase MoaC [Polyangiaceae bacterium]|nr:cyclic pyranopterin monophosphate synthase MoaC [Polyangiaceae bacterium]